MKSVAQLGPQVSYEGQPKIMMQVYTKNEMTLRLDCMVDVPTDPIKKYFSTRSLVSSAEWVVAWPRRSTILDNVCVRLSLIALLRLY